MASIRRTSLAHTNRQTEWAQPMMEMERIDNMQHQKDDETISESELTRRRDISEITRRHLEKVISTMIPLSTCSASDPTKNMHMNSLITQPTQQDKQVIVNNYYIKDKGEGWKQVKAGEISPENSESFIQSKPSEILPNDTTMEIMINPTPKRTGEPGSSTKTGIETKQNLTQELSKTSRGSMQETPKYRIWHHLWSDVIVSHPLQGQEEIWRQLQC